MTNNNTNKTFIKSLGAFVMADPDIDDKILVTQNVADQSYTVKVINQGQIISKVVIKAVSHEDMHEWIDNNTRTNEPIGIVE